MCLADHLCLLPSEYETRDSFLLLPFHAGLRDKHVQSRCQLTVGRARQKQSRPVCPASTSGLHGPHAAARDVQTATGRRGCVPAVQRSCTVSATAQLHGMNAFTAVPACGLVSLGQVVPKEVACGLFGTPRTLACELPLSVVFSRQAS